MKVNAPVTYSFRNLLKMSMSNSVHSIPSKMPICEPSPNDSNIVKNSTAQNGAPGNSTMACVNTINARPVPSAASPSCFWRLQSCDNPHRVVSLM